jgi:phosphoribosylanthranilate isomerase
VKIKLCGFSEIETVKTAIAQKCDFLGFVFYEKSPRHISLQKAVEISPHIPAQIFKVAVVVDANFDFLQEIAQKFAPDFFQFHGNESPEFLALARQNFPKIKIIKALKISNQSDLSQVKIFEDYVDYLLFDNKNAGSGEKFDWKILQNFSSKKDWFLSGGINLKNIDQALQIKGVKLIDISSGIEEIRGKKSARLIAEFMQKIKNHVV